MRLSDFSFRLGGRELAPLVIGGMGVNISTREMALEAARLGGIGHLSDAMLPAVCDRLFGTGFTAAKAKASKAFSLLRDKSQMEIPVRMLREAALRYAGSVMEAKKGAGLVFVNCMEKLTMNDSLRTLSARLNALLDAGVDGITMSAGLHLSSLSLMKENPRFRDAKLGIVVSSVRALSVFMKRAARIGRAPDYVVVEGPLAGGHLGFGLDWANYTLPAIFREVKAFLAGAGLGGTPVIPAGGIFTGDDAVKFMREGAAAVQAATRFTVAKESGLPEPVKQAYFNAEKDDIVVNTISTTGYPMRMLRQSPAIASAARPACEAYGYMLSQGRCQYLEAWLAEGGKLGGPAPQCVKSKTCLCAQMRNYRIWTCGATAWRLKETSEKGPDGRWLLPSTEGIFRNYLEGDWTGEALPA